MEGDPDRDDRVVPAALKRLPRFRVNDQFDRFQPPAELGVVEISNPNQPLAEAFDELLGPLLTWAKGEAGFRPRITAPRAGGLTPGRGA